MHRKHLKGYVFSIIPITALLVSIIGVSGVFAKGASSSHQSTRNSGSPSVTANSTKGTTKTVSGSTVNLLSLPKESASAALANHVQMPIRTSPNLAAAKKTASKNPNAPKA